MENTLYALRLRLRLRLVKTQLNQTYQATIHTYTYLLYPYIIPLYSIILYYITIVLYWILLYCIVLEIHVFQSGSKKHKLFLLCLPIRKKKYQSNHLTSILVLTQPWIMPMLVRRVLYGLYQWILSCKMGKAQEHQQQPYYIYMPYIYIYIYISKF